MRLLTFTTLYPHAGQPNHGVFVENRLRHLLATNQATSTVLAPVPYVPAPLRNSAWGAHAKAPPREVRHGITAYHPRYAVIPRIGMSVAPALLYAASLRALTRLTTDGHRFDLIDAHYVYPDGVAAIWLGRALNLPVVITARGSDVTQLPDYALPRAQIRYALRHAAGLIGVSAALCDRMCDLGADPARVRVLRNGVDLQAFHPPEDRLAARARLGVSGTVLLSVGHLIPRKGHDRAIAALNHLPNATLLIAGDGPERAALQRQAATLGVASRVRLLGTLPHAELPALYGAADLLILASSREGWANVLLESMACGTPVVASPIPGNPEVVQARAAGLIAPANTPEGLAAAATDLLAEPPLREATRAYAEGFGWEQTSQGQLELFRQVLGRPGALPLDPTGASGPRPAFT